MLYVTYEIELPNTERFAKIEVHGVHLKLKWLN